MKLLMADRAVLINRRIQIVNRRRNNSHGEAFARHRRRHIGVAFQTHLPHLRANQHSRVGRSVLLMAGGAAVELHRRMLERERSALIAMALQATRFARRERLRHRRTHGAVRVVAIHALHGIFRNLVPEGHFELRLDIGVAAFAQARSHPRSFCATRSAPPLTCILWQLGHETAFFACVLCMRPACVGWFRWQFRHILSVSAADSFEGNRMKAISPVAACFAPGTVAALRRHAPENPYLGSVSMTRWDWRG